jgi:hypothetical protein
VEDRLPGRSSGKRVPQPPRKALKERREKPDREQGGLWMIIDSSPCFPHYSL